ncbi:MAG: protoporphyrinogen oxidase [Bacteroidales bacterium]
MEQKQKTIYLIIGAGLTGLTLGFYLKKAGKQVMLVDKNPEPGGVIQTRTENGFTYETGPNTGVLSTPELVELFDDLGDKCNPEIANQAAKQRWIWKYGRWHALPSGLIGGVTTPLFSMKDKLRILGEPFRKAGTDPYESVAQLVIRRMGQSFLDYAVDPFISGIYAGDPGSLITRFALPKLYRLEQNYGSFIGGAIKKRKEPKDIREEKATKDVFSVRGGLANLIHAMAGSIDPDNIITGTDAVTVHPSENGFLCSVKNDGQEKVLIQAEKVITTVGAYALPDLLPFLDAALLSPVTQLRYARVIQAVAGYKKWSGIPLQAFGGLVPGKEKREVLGILFPSAIFEGRAPEGGALLSVFLGGMKRPELFDLSDEEVRKLVLEEIHKMMQEKAAPDMLHIFRYPHAIPQYERSSEERLARIIRIEKEYPGLLLAGNIRDGIGIADRVKQGRIIADSLIEQSNG